MAVTEGMIGGEINCATRRKGEMEVGETKANGSREMEVKHITTNERKMEGAIT